MRVTCALFGPLRETVGGKHVAVDVEGPATVGMVLEELVHQEPALEGQVFAEGGELQSITVTINTEHIQHRDGLDTAVEDGDLIRLALPVRGGGALRA